LRRLVSCNSALDAAAAAALRTQFSDPGAAQRHWQAVYRDVEADARLVPNSTASGESVFVSARVGNPHFSPFFGPLLEQLQIRPLRR
jgi:hypothetical protein